MLIPYKVSVMLASGQGPGVGPGVGVGQGVGQSALAPGLTQAQGLAQGQGPGQGTLTPPRLTPAPGPGLGSAEISSLTSASYQTALMLSITTSTINNPLPAVYTEPPPAQDGGGSAVTDPSTPFPLAPVPVPAWYVATINSLTLLLTHPINTPHQLHTLLPSSSPSASMVCYHQQPYSSLNTPYQYTIPITHPSP